MRINDFFLEAMQNNAWHNPKWVKSIFCLRREDPLAWHNDKYPYRIVTANDGYYYLNKELVLTRLEGAEDITRAPVPFREPITVPPNTIPNWASGGETDIGILFANYVLLIGVFHDKIPYINGEVKINKIEKIIVDNREDYPNGDPNNPDRKKDKFYIDEFIKFSRACDYLENFNDLFVPGGSPKMMTLHPDFFAYRDSLVKEYEGKLNNPIYAAEFVNKLLKWDYDNWLKDDPGLGYLKVSKKSLAINRSRVLLTFGGEQTLAKTDGVNFVVKSLVEGWDIDNLSVYFNAQRNGSYSRGAETVLGGVIIKEMTTLSAHAKIVSDDCGSSLGNRTRVKEYNWNNLVGKYFVDAKTKKPVLITEEQKTKLMGTVIYVRNPKFCKAGKVEFCGVCCGSRLAAKPKALGTAVNTIGQIFLEVYMGAAHVKELKSARFDYKKTFGMFV